ncbi:MAG: GSCFA domain-containing protein [Bacteroidales bacterium]
MDFRTISSIEPSERKITYPSAVIFIGSCFAMEIGQKMAEAKMKVMINPSGTVYNPVSIGNAIDIIISKKVFTRENLFHYDNLYHSFYHYTDFTSSDPDEALEKINSSTVLTHNFLKKAGFMFVTFGTARVYRLRETGMIVSNCHKLPSDMFTNELLTVDYIYEFWASLLERIANFNNKLKVIFTVSPVRYLKDGAHGNQISKSILFLAIEQLLAHHTVPAYFPAYELLMDDLRDYRFYAGDMVHPSDSAIDYIFDSFKNTFFDSDTAALYNEVTEIIKARKHRLISPSSSSVKKFAGIMLERISIIEKKNHDIDLSEEKRYFKSLYGYK